MDRRPDRRRYLQRQLHPDGAIDLTAEYNFGHAVNAAKRDRDAQVATDFTTEAFQAFHDGRSLLATTEGALTDDELGLLRITATPPSLLWKWLSHRRSFTTSTMCCRTWPPSTRPTTTSGPTQTLE